MRLFSGSVLIASLGCAAGPAARPEAPPAPAPCPNLSAWADTIGRAGTKERMSREACAPGEDMCGRENWRTALVGGGRLTWAETSLQDEVLFLPGVSMESAWLQARRCAPLEVSVVDWPLPTTDRRIDGAGPDAPFDVIISVKPRIVTVNTPQAANCAISVASKDAGAEVHAWCESG